MAAADAHGMKSDGSSTYQQRHGISSNEKRRSWQNLKQKRRRNINKQQHQRISIVSMAVSIINQQHHGSGNGSSIAITEKP